MMNNVISLFLENVYFAYDNLAAYMKSEVRYLQLRSGFFLYPNRCKFTEHVIIIILTNFYSIELLNLNSLF